MSKSDIFETVAASIGEVDSLDIGKRAKSVERAERIGDVEIAIAQHALDKTTDPATPQGEAHQWQFMYDKYAHLLGEDADQQSAAPEVTSLTAERIRKLVETSHRSALRQVEAMQAAGIAAEKIPTVPTAEEFATHAEVVFAEWSKNGVLELFEEKELNLRLSYVLKAQLSGEAWAKVFRELTKGQPYSYVNEDFLAKFSAEEASGNPEEVAAAAGLRLESQEFIPELRGDVAQQKAAHAKLQTEYPDMNIPEPSMNALVASIACELEAAKDGVLQGEGTFEKTFGRLYGVEGLLDGGGYRFVPGVFVDVDGFADAGGDWVGSGDRGRLSGGENLTA